ncbi:MAG: response regulator transcription factor [Bacteroidetes bacterium]|nr:response regulator transcription factor [Bacteroidota bacterium]MCB0843598.1 response regulator transcription factor [Bacteroidota bacterium]MCB0852424.1 response regulator transcription factor [Bacteroidota bacterium]
MNPIRAIAVDDEPLALEVIQRFAAKIPGLDLIAVFGNPIEAVQYLQTESIDLIFLDIQMPDITGIQFLQSLAESPMIIFTTAYSQYAVDSYELNAVDYLLKPIPFDRFLKAVNKAIMQMKAHEALEHQTETPPESEANHGEVNYLFIKSDTRFFKVDYKDILYIEGMRDYIAVHTPTQKILTLMSMTKMLAKLPERDFMRVHKSYIIGLNHISLIQNNRVIVSDKEIPISHSYKDAFLKFVEGMNT